MDKVLRVGVIGLGIGRHHIKGFQNHPACRVAAIADVDPNRLAAAAKEFAIERTYDDAHRMIATEGLDIVAVATPNCFHKEFTVSALKAGCHVLCEKPMAMNAGEARQMLAAADKAGRALGIQFSFRFNAASQAMKSYVDTGALGDIYTGRTCWLRRHGFPGFGGWFTDRKRSGGGPLIDLGVHRLDLALWLMGYPQPEWVLASTSDVLTRDEVQRSGKPADIENHATGFVRFAGGASLSLEASWACHRAENEFMETHLYGTKAGMVQRNVGGGYQFEAYAYEYRSGAFYDCRMAKTVERERSAMEHFADAILAGQPAPASGAQGLIVQEILDALYRSAAEGKPVQIKAGRKT